MKDLSNEKMIQKEKNGISFLQFRYLDKYNEHLLHGYTMKDLDFHSKGTYIENVEKLQNALGIHSLWIKTKQTHSDHIAVVRENDVVPQVLEDTDGIITNQKNLLVLTSYADCTPILIYDYKKQVIANIHSGWKGTLQQIGPKALKKMEEVFECNPADCIVTIGPNIQKCCFEVGEEVKVLFEKEFESLPNWKEIISKKEEEEEEEKKENKYYIDTTKINKTLLEKMGVLPENIIESQICTKCNSDQLHSFRAEKEQSGRSTTFTLLKEGEKEK